MNKIDFKKEMACYMQVKNCDWHKNFGDFKTLEMVCDTFLQDLDDFLADKNEEIEANDWLLKFLQSNQWRVSGWYQKIELYQDLCFNIFEDYITYAKLYSAVRNSEAKPVG